MYTLFIQGHRYLALRTQSRQNKIFLCIEWKITRYNALLRTAEGHSAVGRNKALISLMHCKKWKNYCLDMCQQKKKLRVQYHETVHALQ